MRIAVIIPAYRVSEQVLGVIARVGPEVSGIFVVDDRCPDGSGALVQAQCRDPRVRVITHEANQGVGGATLTGFSAASDAGFDILVKVDGDGQMDPQLIPRLVRPLLAERADFVKGNRFYALESLSSMPWLRLFGNSALSFVNKLVSGYWPVMDPTNGFVAIHASVFRLLPAAKLARRYFFESDLLFRLSTVRAVVADVPMDAVYAGEVSSLRISQVLWEFPPKYAVRLVKRIFYTYFLRDFNACSLYLVAGSAMMAFGGVFGVREWVRSVETGVAATSGTVLLAALPVILGFQSLLAALSFDVVNVPSAPLCRDLRHISSESGEVP
jgi:dolichol-phosphate mannosyltransferase